MYRTADGEQIYVVDGHIHFWDGSPGNQKNRYAEGWVECFYNYHKNLSPADYVWPLEQYQRYSEQQLMRDLFEEGYVDLAIFQPTYLRDFFMNGCNTIEQDAVLKEKYPDKFFLNTTFDPRLEIRLLPGDRGWRNERQPEAPDLLLRPELRLPDGRGRQRGSSLGGGRRGGQGRPGRPLCVA